MAVALSIAVVLLLLALWVTLWWAEIDVDWALLAFVLALVGMCVGFAIGRFSLGL